MYYFSLSRHSVSQLRFSVMAVEPSRPALCNNIFFSGVPRGCDAHIVSYRFSCIDVIDRSVVRVWYPLGSLSKQRWDRCLLRSTSCVMWSLASLPVRYRISSHRSSPPRIQFPPAPPPFRPENLTWLIFGKHDFRGKKTSAPGFSIPPRGTKCCWHRGTLRARYGRKCHI